MPKLGSDRDKKVEKRKNRQPVHGKSVFVMRDSKVKRDRRTLEEARQMKGTADESD
jgi:hypothetical protein